MSVPDHGIISPAIHYWGSIVVLVSSENEDGTTNIAPMSSAWWLGRSCVLGLGSGSKTTGNILRTGQCVLNLPDDSLAGVINSLARTTGTNPVSDWKRGRKYEFVPDKWNKAGLTPEAADFVRPARIRECAVQLECELVHSTPLSGDLPDLKGVLSAIEVRILRVHIFETLRMPGHPNRVDPDKWRPMVMSFQQLYGLRDGKLEESVLARIGEEEYRGLTKSGVKKTLGEDDDELVMKEFDGK
ncbi:hypothetical protein B0J18DRAFT_426971 [Chaetomium sp. MPI-SDFR-AT-0129]|nr:hypothetical protein B0J18DRAFT_426971 [Chaetomium sp. MPI-SDFR-AT-0129]